MEQFDKNLFDCRVPLWMRQTGPEGDIVLSSRIRLARNLNGVPFPGQADEEQLKQIGNRVSFSVQDLVEADGQHQYRMLDMESLSEQERRILDEKHLTSMKHMQDPANRSLIIRDDTAISIMVNEEDHFRIQSLTAGLNLRSAWEMADETARAVPPTTEFLRAFFKRDRFAAGAGIKLEEARPGYARTRMKVRDAHMNGADVVQGGAVFTLADLAFAVACNSHGTLALAVDVTISFLRPTRTGTLTAEAFEVARSRRLSRCEIKVVDDSGEPVALFHGTAFVKDELLVDLAAAMRKGTRRKRAR